MPSDNIFEPAMENESIITVNVSDVHAGFIYTATAIYGSVVICGCITVVLFIAVLLKGNTTFKEYQFFKIVWALTIVNAIHMTMQLTCIFPSLFINIEEGSLMEIWYGISSRIIFATDYGAVIFLLLMALNRFAVFIAPFMQPIFSKKLINKTVLVGWLITIAVSCLRQLFLQPKNKFLKKNWEFTSIFTMRDGIVYNFISMSSYLIPIIIFVIYISIYAFLRKKRLQLMKISAETNDANSDLNLLREGFLLAVSLIAFRLFTTYAPTVHNNVVLEWIINITKSISSTFNQMLNPILFFSSNSTVRKTFRKLMKCQKSDHVVVLSNSDIPSARHSFSLGTKVRIRVTKFGRKSKTDPENGAATSSATSQSPIAMTKVN
ncbi:hypothetical protein WR25_10871 [Diploscapter pachys]|uniref:G-protein coupled receptors family 1 profile domain-containing protein n=1 Tax=Diploscapter pachys TaxID=2018661 RepID=A0A2A2LZJ7_9BILA|nr:hypothetical protein WR25_10871 [Diploscapter pachys]